MRYHWNNEANDYDTAWILRDADKIDGFGEEGLSRAHEFFKDDEEAYNQNFRNQFDCFVHIRTQTAKNIIADRHLMEPLEKAYHEYLQSKIEPVEL